MRVWAVANRRGGIGKTAMTITLAGLPAQRGARALVVDLDSHGSMTAYFGHEPESVKGSADTL